MTLVAGLRYVLGRIICVTGVWNVADQVILGVGVPMFWPDWKDQKMRQHQNHFQTSGSSPPRSREGSLYDFQRYMSLKLQFKMLGQLQARGCLFDFCLVVGNQERRVQYKTWVRKEYLGKGGMIQRTSRPLGNGVKKGFTCYSMCKLSIGLVI